MFWKSQESNEALTDNLDRAYKSTMSAVLDLFSRGGAYRAQPDADCIALFSRALAEDENLAMRCLFYLRDIRGGAGERRFFRVILKYLADAHPDLVRANITNIAEFGRFDDLISSLLDTGVKDSMVEFIRAQLALDLESGKPSLLAKWMPSNVTSSKKTVKEALKLIGLLGMTPKAYRQMLSRLRSQIRIVEQQISANRWGDVNYEHVPSKASLKLSKAFKRHDEERYVRFLADVKQGTKAIHAGVLYPHEIVRKILLGDVGVPALDALWNSLPDYAGDQNAVVICDTSGSMSSLQQDPRVKVKINGIKLPLSISVGLALYFAERNRNEAFKMRFLTFSRYPELQFIEGETIVDKVNNLSQAAWDGNTDLRLAFKVMLDRAKQFKVPAEEMPKTLYIISDLQFDTALNNRTSYDDVKQMYADAGYFLPIVVFWQVNAFRKNSPVTVSDANTILVSGVSPVIFRFVLESKSKSPVDFMKSVLMQERYDAVKS